MVMIKTHSGTHRIYCLEIDNASIHLQSPFYEHKIRLEPRLDVQIVREEDEEDVMPIHKKKKRKLIVPEENDDDDVAVNRSEEEVPQPPTKRQKRSSKTVIVEKVLRVIDPQGLLNHFTGNSIYRLVEWQSQMPYKQATAVSTDRHVFNIITHSFYFMELVGSSGDDEDREASDHAVQEDAKLDALYRSQYKQRPSFTHGSSKSIIWHHNEESTERLKVWLEMFQTMCIEKSGGASSSTTAATHSKLAQYWEKLHGMYKTEDVETLEVALLNTLQSRMTSYVEDAGGEEEHVAVASPDVFTGKSTSVKSKPLHTINYKALSGIMRSFHGLKCLNASLLCCIQPMTRIFNVFHELQSRCDPSHPIYSLSNMVSVFKLTEMGEDHLSDCVTFIRMIDRVMENDDANLEAMQPQFHGKDAYFHNYTWFISSYITQSNLDIIMKLWSYREDFHPHDAIQKRFIVFVVLRYIVYSVNEIAYKRIQSDKKTLYPASLEYIRSLASNLNCHWFDSTDDTAVLFVLLHFLIDSHEALSQNMSWYHKCRIHDFSDFRWYFMYTHHSGRNLDLVTVVSLLRSGEEVKLKKAKYFVMIHENEFKKERKLNDLVGDMNVSPMSIRAIFHPSKHGSETAPETTTTTNNATRMDLIVYSSVDILLYLDLEHFYLNYYLNHLHTTLVIRPHNNYNVNRSIHSYFMKKQSLHSIFYKDKHCRTTADFYNEDTLKELTSYNYEIVFIPYAHYYSTEDYYRILSWVRENKRLKAVIITGTMDCVPCSSFGQPFVDHLRKLTTKTTGYMFNRHSSSSAMLDKHWFHALTPPIFYEHSEKTEKAFIYQSICNVVKAKKCGKKLVLYVKGFDRGMPQFMSILMDYSSILLQKVSSRKEEDSGYSFLLSGQEYINIHHIQGPDGPITASPIYNKKVTVDMIKIQTNLYERKTNLMEYDYHLHIYTIYRSVLSSLSLNECMHLFILLDNLFIIDDDDNDFDRKKKKKRTIKSTEDVEKYLIERLDDGQSRAPFLYKTTFMDIHTLFEQNGHI
jgi:hypothetical protein